MKDYEFDIELEHFEIDGEEYGAHIRYIVDSAGFDDDKKIIVTHCDLVIGCGAWLTMHPEYYPMVEAPLTEYLMNEALRGEAEHE